MANKETDRYTLLSLIEFREIFVDSTTSSLKYVFNYGLCFVLKISDRISCYQAFVINKIIKLYFERQVSLGKLHWYISESGSNSEYFFKPGEVQQRIEFLDNCIEFYKNLYLTNYNEDYEKHN